MHHAIGATNHHDRVVADLQGEEVTLGRNLAGHAGNQPFLVENLLHVDLEQPLIVVERLRQGKGSLAVLQHLGGCHACRLQRIAQTQGGSDVHR